MPSCPGNDMSLFPTGTRTTDWYGISEENEGNNNESSGAYTTYAQTTPHAHVEPYKHYAQHGPSIALGPCTIPTSHKRLRYGSTEVSQRSELCKNLSLATIQPIPNFLISGGEDLAVAGHPETLNTLWATMRLGVKVRATNHMLPYGAYIPLQISLRDMCLRRRIECPSLAELHNIHRSSEFQKYSALKRKLVVGTPGYLDLPSIALILELLAKREITDTGKHTFYQLGTISEEDVLYAHLHTKSTTDPFCTIWLYYDSTATQWSGICSDKAFDYLQPQATPQQVEVEGSSQSDPQSVHAGQAKQNRPQTAHLPSQRDSHDRVGRIKPGFNHDDGDEGDSPENTALEKEKGKRRTAIQIQMYRNEFPAHSTPTDIINHPHDFLHYNNLLRVAIWFSNKDIFDRLNTIRRLQGEPESKALSSITKRIGVACEFLGVQMSVPKNVFRAAFNKKRAQNGISTREAGRSNLEREVELHQEDISRALDMVFSASATSGLAIYREVAPLVTRDAPHSTTNVTTYDAGNDDGTVENEIPAMAFEAPHDTPFAGYDDFYAQGIGRSMYGCAPIPRSTTGQDSSSDFFAQLDFSTLNQPFDVSTQYENSNFDSNFDACVPDQPFDFGTQRESYYLDGVLVTQDCFADHMELSMAHANEDPFGASIDSEFIDAPMPDATGDQLNEEGDDVDEEWCKLLEEAKESFGLGLSTGWEQDYGLNGGDCAGFPFG